MGKKSLALFERAGKIIPGGVNSPVRAFSAVGDSPRFIARGNGSRIWDEDGKEYLDYVSSWGPLILGHSHPRVLEAVTRAAQNGCTFGAATSQEILLAEKIRSAIPSMEKIRLVSSGTEATMTAIRLARAYTGRNKILKFEGCYHGHADPFLVKAGSGLLTFGNPSSKGVPDSVLRDTLVGTYNVIESAEEAFERHGGDLACVIVEPVAGNMGVVLPCSGFLARLNQLCRQAGAALIFDEVITGFRLHFGGYQSLCGVNPDLTCLGKIIGGGLPLAAVGGRSDILSLLAPLGPVYQAGTLSGNPLAVAAGLATLDVLREEKRLYEKLEENGSILEKGILNLSREKGLPITVNRIGSMFTLFFREPSVETFADVMASNREHYKIFFNMILDRGIYPPPSPFESWFISTAHTRKEIDDTLAAMGETFSLMNETTQRESHIERTV